MKKIYLSGKKGIGKFALVDDEDYDNLSFFTWWNNVSKSGGEHAKGKLQRNNKSVRFYMHGVVMKFQNKSGEIDHIDGNGLNNQKSNLRFCTKSENLRNTRKKSAASSMYKGVRKIYKSHTVARPWDARITVNKNTIYLGCYATEKEAAENYNKAAQKYFGEFARLNTF